MNCSEITNLNSSVFTFLVLYVIQQTILRILGNFNLKDIGIFIGYSPSKKAYRIYNKRTRQIMETMNVQFDELTQMASEQHGSGPNLQGLTSGQISSGLCAYQDASTSAKPPNKERLDLRFNHGSR
ncbi:hypothetical protein Tco_0840709 [Tanacetum coccineum]|uniref:Retroviral polymerase SH3-like domain-containing protein n=1 Tax=Tanacetum coccineum TaxID=301880 RepID=A0ABQ5AWY5_9ASTR